MAILYRDLLFWIRKSSLLDSSFWILLILYGSNFVCTGQILFDDCLEFPRLTFFLYCFENLLKLLKLDNTIIMVLSHFLDPVRTAKGTLEVGFFLAILNPHPMDPLWIPLMPIRTRLTGCFDWPVKTEFF